MNKSNLPWFRFYTETVSDTKFDVAARRLGFPKIELIGIWAILLSLASKSPTRGALMVTSSIPYNLLDLAALCGVDKEKIEMVLKCFEELEMVEYINTDQIAIKNWNKRQFDSDSSAERTKEYRKNKETNTPSHDRHNAVTVAPPDTDTESDIETEKEVVVAAQTPKSNIYSLYEANIGLLNPMITEKLKMAEDEFPPGWIQKAIEISVENNARNWNYIQAILDRWRVKGYDGDKKNGKHRPIEQSKNVIDEIVEEISRGTVKLR